MQVVPQVGGGSAVPQKARPGGLHPRRRRSYRSPACLSKQPRPRRDLGLAPAAGRGLTFPRADGLIRRTAQKASAYGKTRTETITYGEAFFRRRTRAVGTRQ